MPLYEYECPIHGKFDKLNPIGKHSEFERCPQCGLASQRQVSSFSWYMGWKHLANVKSEPAPNDAGYHPKWDKFTP